MKYTLGPWKLGPLEDDPKAFRKVLGGSYGMHNIAQVVKRQSRQEEDEANARLIAAAPDLLEACRVALLSFSPNHAPGNYHQISRAIAKATRA